MQTRASSFAESLTNLGIGIIGSWLITFWVLPWWGLMPSVGQAVEITLVYTLWSVTRSYAIRRAFNRVAA